MSQPTLTLFTSRDVWFLMTMLTGTSSSGRNTGAGRPARMQRAPEHVKKVLERLLRGGAIWYRALGHSTRRRTARREVLLVGGRGGTERKV